MLEQTIEFSMEVFARLFKFELNWCFADITANTSHELRKSVTMAYNHDDKLIIINPLLLEQFDSLNYSEEQLSFMIFSLIAHEYRHAWQHKNDEFIQEWTNYKTFIKTKDDYLFQRVEMDAYAFQEACYWIISGELNHHLSIPEEAANFVHKQAVDFYYEYRSEINTIISNIILEFQNDKL